jgi:hypothetical protein
VTSTSTAPVCLTAKLHILELITAEHHHSFRFLECLTSSQGKQAVDDEWRSERLIISASDHPNQDQEHVAKRMLMALLHTTNANASLDCQPIHRKVMSDAHPRRDCKRISTNIASSMPTSRLMAQIICQQLIETEYET